MTQLSWVTSWVHLTIHKILTDFSWSQNLVVIYIDSTWYIFELKSTYDFMDFTGKAEDALTRKGDAGDVFLSVRRRSKCYCKRCYFDIVICDYGNILLVLRLACVNNNLNVSWKDLTFLSTAYLWLYCKNHPGLICHILYFEKIISTICSDWSLHIGNIWIMMAK